jgi:hypothetical protein
MELKKDRFTFGNIYQRFLILEIISISFYQNESLLFLNKLSKMARNYLA